MSKIKQKIMWILCCFTAIILGFGIVFSVSKVKALSAITTLLGDKVINDTWVMYSNNKTTIKPTGPDQSGYPLKNINDGNFNTFWHVDWDTNKSKNPETKIIPDEEIYVNGIMYATRFDSLSGSLTDYRIVAETANGEEEVAKGKIDGGIGIYYIPFTKVVKTKLITIKSQFSSCSELSLAYINYEKLPEIIKEAKNVYEQAHLLIGDSEGKYPQIVVDDFALKIYNAEKVNEKTTDEEKVKITAELVESTLGMNNNVIVDAKKVNDKFKQIKTVINSIPEGTEVLHMEKSVKDGYISELNEISNLIGVGDFCQKSFVDEANKRLDKISKTYSKNVKAPIIKCFLDNDYQRDKEGNIITYERLTDSDNNTGWVYFYKGNFNGIVNSNDEKLYFDYDYQNEVQVESLTVASFFASYQSVTTLKVQAYDGTKYNDIETLHFNLYGNDSTTKYQTIKFAKPFKASKIRVHIDGAKTGHGAIDLKEMNFALSANESDVKVVFENKKMELKEGSVVNLKHLVLPFYLSNKDVTYNSSDTSVVEVDGNGIVKISSLPEGQESCIVTITVTTALYGKTDSCEITVIPASATEQLKRRTLRKIEIIGYILDAEVNKDSFDPNLVARVTSYFDEAKIQINESTSLGTINKISKNIDKIKEELKASNQQNIIQAKALIERIAKDKNADEKFEYELIRKVNDHDVFGLSWNTTTKKPILKGNNTVSFAMAFNYYLKNYLYQTVPYIGEYKITIPENMVAIDKKDEFIREIPFDIRILRNMTDGVYTYRYYGLDDHERIADWMALNGYNYILSVWKSEQREKYVRLGISLTGGTFSGGMSTSEIPGLQDIIYEKGVHPGGSNDRKYTVLDENLKDENGNVLKDSDGHTLTPDGGSPFYGCVAVSAARWQGIAPSMFYISPFVVENHQVLPEDDERAQKALAKFIDFSKTIYERGIDQRLLKKYGFMPEICIGELITEAGFVAESEAFPKDKVVSVFSDAFLNFNPYGTWCHSSWTIQDWVTRQFEKDHFIVQDLECERNPKWQNSNEFHGSDWIYSVIQNFGGNNGLTGELNKMAVDISTAMTNAKHLKGIGFAPEAGEVDPLFVDYYSELIYMAGNITDGSLSKAEQYIQADEYTDNWLKKYSKRRYGVELYDANTEKMDEFMVAIHDNLYNKFVQQGPSQAVVCGHPVINGTPKARTWGTTSRTYSNIRPLFDQWKNLLEIGKSGKELNEQFKYDLIDYSRQIMADFSLEIYQRFKSAYNKRDIVNAEKYLDQMITLCDDLDKLLGTNYMFTVARREDLIRNGGYVQTEEKIKEMLLYDKMKNTVFDFGTYNINGDGLNDYANRHWSGMMSFYKGRWEIFKNAVMNDLNGKTRYNQGAVNNAIKTQSFNWAKTPYTKEETTFIYKNNELEVSIEMYNKYIKLLNDVDVNVLVSKYNEVKETKLEGYTQESIDEFNKILEEAKTVINNDNPSKQQVDDMVVKLNKIFDVLKVDKTILSERITVLEQIELEIYTEDSIKAFSETLDTAKNILNNEKATVQDIAKAVETLHNCEDLLVIDKKSVEDIYNSLNNIDLKGYSNESIKEFKRVLEESKAIIDKEDITADEIKNVLDKLNNATNILKIDKSELLAKYNELKDMDKVGYTTQSIDSLNNLLNKVKVVIDNEDATIEEISTAINSLEKADKILKVDKSLLISKYDEYKNIDLSKYDKNTSEHMKESILLAEKVINNIDASIEDVNNAKNALENAYKLLKKENGCGSNLSSSVILFVPFSLFSIIILSKKRKINSK